MVSDLWYKNAIVYCLAIERFMDTNGDGIGDFAGPARRLDYLQGLGVTTIWLLPFQPSPQRDDGYDISDYYGVDPRYGTLGDFVEFTHAAAQRGMRVIIDLVVNHTSDRHPWFKAARRDPDSPYRDWYHWSKEKPEGADQGMVFPGVQKTTWTYDSQAKAYYFHRFYDFQPDLNTANPAVQAEILQDHGLLAAARGVRLSRRRHAVRDRKRAPASRSRPRIMTCCASSANFCNGGRATRSCSPRRTCRRRRAEDYFGDDGDRIHMMFNFPVNQHLFYAFATGDAEPLIEGVGRDSRAAGHGAVGHVSAQSRRARSRPAQ